jgi:hypothetical protein
MDEYSHVAIDKGGIGLPALMAALNQNGVQTAQTGGILLAPGSQKLEHHLQLVDQRRLGLQRQHPA